MWWVWVLVAWSAAALGLGLLLGPAMREADRRTVTENARVAALAAAGGPAEELVRWRPTRRRRLPVPPFAVALGLVAVALEALGLVLRSVGRTTGSAQLLAMDEPWSVPRMFITALFLAAAVAAVMGAIQMPERRTWWTAVAIVATVIAVIKGGGTVHTRILGALGGYEHPVLATLVSGSIAAAVIAGLSYLSRTERRDRRRVLGAFSLYAVAAVGLSSISSVVSGDLAAGATFFEESGEALAAITVLVAVLAGVVPRLVLPADWVLRRTEDTAEATRFAPGLAGPLR